MEVKAQQKQERAVWFDELISTLRVHELQLETETADPKLKKLYESIFSNNLDEVFRMNKAASQKYFVQKIVLDYLTILDDKMPIKLAFDFNDSEVLVWAEIEDNDQECESQLTRAEA